MSNLNEQGNKVGKNFTVINPDVWRHVQEVYLPQPGAAIHFQLIVIQKKMRFGG